MPRTVNPAAHARQRARILAAAAQEFAIGGYDATSTASICRRAGVGSGTLFHYFPAKQDVLHALFADDLPRVEEIAGRAAAHHDADAGVDLLVDHLVGEIDDPLAPGLAAVAVLRAAQDPAFAAMLERRDRLVHHALTGLLERLVRQHPGRLAFSAGATARWIVGVVDAQHLDLVDRSASATELETVLGWLLGRQRRPRSLSPELRPPG